ncbi:MAG TPA: cysteine desulfurase family protein [Candidatus Deferrimicrobiaceae bacterium]|nr:cysteine desulfurase family protein [Candidatus Deferrimicrobiaceae bacterium]
MRKIYLDHNATTPVHPEVRKAVEPYLSEQFGNPSSIHWAGRDVRKGVEDARQEIASFFGCQPLEVVFTSSGTESDNLAIKGVAFCKGNGRKHIITSQVEHPAVMNACRFLGRQGFRVTYVPVNRYGIVEPDSVREALTPDTILVTVMYANNETGSIMPIPEIGAIAREAGAIMHTDAVQAAGKLPIDFGALPVDMLTFSGHKVNALKGAGGLIIRKGMQIEAVIHGGHQERGRRGGTENVVGIVAMGKSFELLRAGMEEEVAVIRRLRDKFENGLFSRIPELVLNGHPAERLPNTVNISFRFVEGEAMLLNLDMMGIACSSGSACTSGSLEASPILMAMGADPTDAQGALRFSLGMGNTDADVEYAIDAIETVVNKLRAMSPIYPSRKEAKAR